MQEVKNVRRTRYVAAALIVCLLGLLAVSGIQLVRDNTNSFLRSNANHAAASWSEFIAASTPDFNDILQGAEPKPSTLRNLRNAASASKVYAFKVFDTAGRLVLEVDRRAVPVSGSPFPRKNTPAGVNAGQIGRPSLELTWVSAPIVLNRQNVGHINLLLDQSGLRAAFVSAFTNAGAVSLALITLTLVTALLVHLQQSREARARLKEIQERDVLTNLPSRSAFFQAIDNALDNQNSGKHVMAIMIADLDRFMEINETFGTEVGDYVLCSIAMRLEAIAGRNSIVARLGGDNFGILLPELESKEDAATIGRDILSALNDPVSHGNNNIKLKSTLGVSMAPADGTDRPALTRRADLARFAAKEDGGNQLRFYDASTEAHYEGQRKTERTVQRACDSQSFRLHYQPLYSLRTGRLKSFEALIRLPDGKGGMISPAEFIPAAERTRKINEIGQWALHEACAAAATWPEELTIAVNLSPIQFNTGDLLDHVRSALNASGLAAKRLELEVTEGLMLEDSEEIRDQLAQLQELGIKIVLDDFGSGYSSLNYLWRFPFDKIKIDQSFIRGMAHNAQAKGILKTIVNLGRTMNLQITAEGVETLEQARFLRQIDCDLVQGYLFGRPLPVTDVAGLVLSDFRARISPSAVIDDKPRITTKQALAG